MKGRLADYRPAMRRCLGCERFFGSQGPGNRKCPACRLRENAPLAGLSRRQVETAADVRRVK